MEVKWKPPITSELYESPKVSLNQHLQRKAKETRARAGSIDQSIEDHSFASSPSPCQEREDREKERGQSNAKRDTEEREKRKSLTHLLRDQSQQEARVQAPEGRDRQHGRGGLLGLDSASLRAPLRRVAADVLLLRLLEPELGRPRAASPASVRERPLLLDPALDAAHPREHRGDRSIDRSSVAFARRSGTRGRRGRSLATPLRQGRVSQASLKRLSRATRERELFVTAPREKMRPGMRVGKLESGILTSLALGLAGLAGLAAVVYNSEF